MHSKIKLINVKFVKAVRVTRIVKMLSASFRYLQLVRVIFKRHEALHFFVTVEQ